MQIVCEVSSSIELPNVYRLLEFCYNKRPQIEHAQNCSEIDLKLARRQFKEWLEKINIPDAHISGIEQALARDWISRIAIDINFWRSEDD